MLRKCTSALPEGDEWSFNAWAPKVIGNDAYVPLCHYSGREGHSAPRAGSRLGPDRRRGGAASARTCAERGTSAAKEPSDRVLEEIVEEEQRR